MRRFSISSDVRTCDCKHPAPAHNPTRKGTCIKCGFLLPPPKPLILECAKCSEPFDIEQGRAGIYLAEAGDPVGGALTICASCAVILSEWLGVEFNAS